MRSVAHDPVENAEGRRAPALPDWPRLMGVDLAARYFGVSANTFKTLNIAPRSIGRRVLWDRLDLDRYADRLGGQPLAASDATAEAAEVERRFLERRRGKN